MEGIEGAMNTVMNNASATTSHTRMQDREATIPQWAPGDSFTVLGIESSCDETGVGITRVTIQDDGSPQVELIADQVASSMEEHRRFGGVVPEIASRAHLEAIVPIMHAALAEAGIEKPDMVAATVGPGLAGALLVGAAAAKAYAAGWGVPFYGVNHLRGTLRWMRCTTVMYRMRSHYWCRVVIHNCCEYVASMNLWRKWGQRWMMPPARPMTR